MQSNGGEVQDVPVHCHRHNGFHGVGYQRFPHHHNALGNSALGRRNDVAAST